MFLVLTMAGKYTRFQDFSYKIPKYLLPLSNRTILHYVVESFVGGGQFTDILLVANVRDIRFRPQVVDTAGEFGIDPGNVIFIDDTPGQASTALVGLKYFSQREKLPVVIHNIDTILYDRDFEKIKKELMGSSDCVIDVFRSSNREYSYVLLDNGQVISILEKKVISDIASSGCYCFSDSKIAEEYVERSISEKKYYISEAIAKMIQEGKRVSISEIKTEQQTVVLGTPEEYISSIANVRR